jgi:small nuclear ribonucleoprotein
MSALTQLNVFKDSNVLLGARFSWNRQELKNRSNTGGKFMAERQPLKLLLRSINNIVLVKLKDGREYKGRLIEMDNYMNLVLSGAEEIENDEHTARFGEVFIRGNNILFIKPDVTASSSEEK